jgi:glycosyltransferase involved in cell wall biosynthesis
MKIHVWAPEFATFGGGIGKFSRELAFALHRLGHDLLLAGKLDYPVDGERGGLWGAAGYPRVARNAAFAAGVLARCARHRPDRVISSHLNFGPVARIASTTFGVPYTLVAHGIDVGQHLSSAKKAALRSAGQVIAVSSWTRKRLLQVGGISAERIVLLPNTVNGNEFNVGAPPASLRARYGLGDNEKVILTVARLGPSETLAGYKGCDRTLEALPAVRAECGSVRYIIVGTGPDRFRLEEIATKLGISSAVTFAGFVPDDELADHYRLADAYVMPSTGEGFGIVFLEAMACGTPVLAGNADGSVDALDAGRLGKLVNPTSVPEITAGLIALLKREGPDWWFDRSALHHAVIDRFGRDAFRNTLAKILDAA